MGRKLTSFSVGTRVIVFVAAAVLIVGAVWGVISIAGMTRNDTDPSSIASDEPDADRTPTPTMPDDDSPEDDQPPENEQPPAEDDPAFTGNNGIRILEKIKVSSNCCSVLLKNT